MSLIGTIQDVSWEQGLIRTLQETQDRYRHMEQIAHIGNWVIDLDKGESHLTDEFLRIYDIEPGGAPMSLEEVRSFVTNHHRKELDVLIDECRASGQPYSYKVPIITKKGAHKILMTRGEAVKDTNGRIYRLAGTVQDITQQQDVLNRLQRSEILYKQAQAMGSIGNWVMDTETDDVEWSDEVYHIFELDAAKGQGQADAMKMILPEDLKVLRWNIDTCKKDGIPFTCQYRVQMPDGRIKHFSAKGELLSLALAEGVQMIGTVQDITDQVLIERRLQENQRFTQKITDIAPSIIAVLNMQTGQYDYMSLAVEKLLGYTRAECLEGGPAFVFGLVHPDDVADLVTKNNAALANANEQLLESPETISEFKYRVKHKSGEYRWLQTFGTVFDRDEHHQVKQILNVSIDITGEKQAEQILSYKNLLLQQSNSSLEEFAYIASHDLQEPLRKISTFGNMLETLQEDNLSDSGKLYIRKIVDSSIRMQGMINDILSVSLISGNRTFKKENLQPLLDEVLLTLEHKIDQTQATIEVPDNLGEATVIAAQFRQLMQNLISNSLKFARVGVPPVIKITCERVAAEDLIGMDVDPEKTYLRIRFSDNGIGFSNNYAGKIFAIFQRLNGKSEYEGTGIGLAICKKIVEHHKGSIMATGEPGAGATFTIVIPE